MRLYRRQFGEFDGSINHFRIVWSIGSGSPDVDFDDRGVERGGLEIHRTVIV